MDQAPNSGHNLSPHPDTPTPEPAPGPKDRAGRVRAAIETWKTQLIDLGGRNTLLFYRDQKLGTLDLTAADQDAIDALLTGKSVRSDRLFRDDAIGADVGKRLRRIHAKAREHYEERGIATLYLGCGLAGWKTDRTAAEPSAPVLLCPATLTPKGAAQDVFDLELTGEMEVNPTLLHLMETDFGLKLDPATLSDHLDGAIDTRWELAEAYAWIAKLTTTVPEFAIAERMVLGTFSYAKLPMVKDLEASVEALIRHDLIAAVAGDPDARGALATKNAAGDVSLDEPDRTPPADEFLVLDADASQNYAINAVTAGHDLIVRGPPGTGKSQTIANLISTALARGKTVLFVAEKRAAIDAVFKRLQAVQLDDLLLDLHGATASRRQVAETLARSLQLIGRVPREPHDAQHEDLAARRTTLNGYSEAVRMKRLPWDISILEAQVRVYGIPSGAHTDLRFTGKVLTGLDAPTAARVHHDVQRLAELGAFTPAVAQSPWRTAIVNTPDEAQSAFDAVQLLRETMSAATYALGSAATETNHPPAATLSAWGEMIETWRRAGDAAAILDENVYTLSLDDLIASFAPAGRTWRHRLVARLTSGAYRQARGRIRSVLRDQGTSDAAAYSALVESAEAWRAWTAANAAGHPTAPRNLDELREQLGTVKADSAVLARTLGPIVLDTGNVASIEAYLDRCVADRSVLLRIPDVRERWAALEANGLARFLIGLLTDQPELPLCAARFDFAWLQSIIERVEFADPRIGAVDADQLLRTVSEYRAADASHIAETAGRIRRLYAERAVAVRDLYPNESALVTGQAARKRGHLPMRRLFGNAPHVLLALKPCWAMSPLLVSQVLPSDRAYFDLVVFDEASQVMPADAMPSILRGTTVVVAGDDRQLPPTTFFASQASESDEDEEQALELAWTKGFESILNSLAPLLNERSLTWHYRSRDERLIAFSNYEFYDRSLTTFPGVTADDCLDHVLVPFRPGIPGSEKSMTDEVQEVVRLILAHAEKRPHESLGVIALGITHANRIEEALRELLRWKPDLGEFFAESNDEPFFIKNLERVQGDERDAIILSVGYGKTADGRLLYRFGPINIEGGERRLNVAVTRAKRRMTVVSSFGAAEMDPARTPSKGARLLRDYLRYAESHGASLGDGEIDHPALNPFEINVRDHLALAGVPVVAQLGASGYYIDFAAQHPRLPEQYVLAIECDGASYHSSPTARDRDRLRQEQLERLGWRFHRIWSGDWFRDRDRALGRVVGAYQRAVEDFDAGLLTAQGARRPSPPTSESPDVSTARRRQVNLPSASPRGPRPRVTPGRVIDDYSARELAALVNWIESDTLLRTEDEVLSAVMSDLGFRRRGAKIVDAIESAIRISRAKRRRKT